MPDSAAGSWAAINGEEFVNAQRTVSYVQNFGLPITVDKDCWCPDIQQLLDCPNEPVSGYSFPYSDPAPWYDPAIPESGDFLGFLPTEFEGLGSTYTRQTFPTLSGGAVLGRLQPQARTLTWRGYLFGRTCCAAEYGLEWLIARLATAGGCDGCDGAELDLLICCPEATGTVPNPATTCRVHHVNSCSTGQDVGDAPVIGAATSNDEAFRTLYRVGLADGPKVLDRRTIGCGGDCDEGGCLIHVEFSLVAGNPFLHTTPERTICKQGFPPCDATCDPNDPVWIAVKTTTYPASTADGLKCEDSLDCAVFDSSLNCILDPNCPTAELPVVPGFEDNCGCEGFFNTRMCCYVASSQIAGKFFESVPSIDIYSGQELDSNGNGKPLRNVIVSFYENPQQRTCADTTIFKSDCFKCATVNIRYIPPNTTLTVDGLTKRIMAKCPGRDAVAAESLTVSPFVWPVLSCIDYLVTVEADCSFPVASDAEVTITVIPRQM